MEQHPVPQNVTTFQFRLIGDMTLKQFGYLAAGAIAAYVCYKLPLPFFFTWPLTIASALLGFGLAFVPIEERPMDIWILSFFKSIYSPTQYVWHKAPTKEVASPAPTPAVQPIAQRGLKSATTETSRELKFATTKDQFATTQKQNVLAHFSARSVTDALARIFAPVPPASGYRPTVKPMPAPSMPIPQAPPPSVVPMVYTRRPFDPFGWVRDMFQTKPKRVAADTSLPDIFSKVPTGSLTGKRLDLSTPPQVTQTPQVTQAVSEAQKKTVVLEEKLGALQSELQSKTLTGDRILELQQQLTDALAQREQLEKQLFALRQKFDATATPTPPPVRPAGTTTTTAIPQQPTVKIITPDAAVKAGLPRLTTFPNVITGIVKDNANTFLPGVLVTVRDREGVPLRALKTNKLGQFAASTPLPNGTYLVEVEDPRSRFTFDRAQITVNGNIMPALEIIAKSMKELSREKLAKEIFGNAN